MENKMKTEKVQQTESKKYNVSVPIKGVACMTIMANSPKDAKEIALKQTELLGTNGYYWWHDTNNPMVGLSDTDMINPEVTDIQALENNDEWLLI